MKKQVSEKTMSRLLKVFELHKRGVDGEAENATVLLAQGINPTQIRKQIGEE